jgi:hypothetical protein
VIAARRVLSLALALVLCAYAAPVGARHGGVVIDARRATPGVQLTLVEKASPGPRTTYGLVAAGVPRGVLFGVWTKDFGQSFQQVAAGFRLNEGGVLETVDDAGRPRRLEDLVLDPGSYPPGAVWEVALVSADQALMAFAKVVPRPIAAQQGACRLLLELVSRRGDRFLAAAQGFTPGESVVVELQQARSTTEKRVRVLPDGRLPLDVISHGTAAADPHARYTVKGRACEVAVDYTWGEPALTRP